MATLGFFLLILRCPMVEKEQKCMNLSWNCGCGGKGRVVCLNQQRAVGVSGGQALLVVLSDGSGWWPESILTPEKRRAALIAASAFGMLEHGCSSKLPNCAKENTGHSPCAAQMFAQKH